MSQRQSGKSTDSPKSEEHSPPTTSEEDLRLVTIPDVPSPATSSILENTRNVEPIAQVTSATSLDRSQQSSTENGSSSEQADQTAEAQRAEDAAETRRISLQTSFTDRVQHWTVTPRPENSNQEVQALSPRRSPLGDLTRYHRDLAQSNSDRSVRQWTEHGPIPRDNEPSSSAVMPTSSALTASRTSPDSSFAPLMRYTEEPTSGTFSMVESERRYRQGENQPPVFPPSASFSLLMALNQRDQNSRSNQIAPEPGQAAPSSSQNSVDLSFSGLNVHSSSSSDSLRAPNNSPNSAIVDGDSNYQDELLSSDVSSSIQRSPRNAADSTASTEFSVEPSISTQESGSGPWLDREPVGFDHPVREPSDEEGIPIVSDGETTDEETSYEWDEPHNGERAAVEPRRIVDPERQAMIEQRWEDMDTAQSLSPVPGIVPVVPEDPAYDASAEDHSITGAPPAKRRRGSDASQVSSSLRTTSSDATSASGFDLVTTSESKSSSSLDRDSTHPTEEHSTEDSEGGVPIVSDDDVSDEEYSFDPEDVVGHGGGAVAEPRRVVDEARQAMIDMRWEEMDTASERSPVGSSPVVTKSSESGLSAADQSITKSTDSSSPRQSSQRSASLERTTSRSSSPVPSSAQDASEHPDESAEKPTKAPATQAPAAKRRPKRK